jgi:UPF0716 protein FxsA
VLPFLLIMFIGMPIAELAVLLKVHEHFGLPNTIALVFLTGVVGALLARAQGLMVLTGIQRDVAQGQMPAPRMMDGVMILVAGVLLITPGLITDTAGFLLLCPPVRAVVRMWLRNKCEEAIRSGNKRVVFWGGGNP